MKAIKILLVLVLIAVALFVFGKVSHAPSIEDYAVRVIEVCQGVSHRPSCYEREIPKLMSAISMEEVFEVTAKVQDKDQQFVYCHTSAHQVSVQETQKKDSDWKNVLLRCPMAMCNYGCMHGVLIGRFRGEYLTDEQIEEALPDMEDICETRTGKYMTQIDTSTCYHGIGHLAMYMTDGDPHKAIGICERIAYRGPTEDHRQTCVGGVFMTVFQSIDPEDLALVIDIKPKKEDVSGFCAQYPKYWQNCRRESFALFLDELHSSDRLVQFCSYATDEEAARQCYLVVVDTMTTAFFENSDGFQKVENFCASLSGNGRKWCYAAAATRMVQTDPLRYVKTSNRICEAIADASEKDYCYKDLLWYATSSFAPGSQQQREYCEALSESWKEKCLKKNH